MAKETMVGKYLVPAFFVLLLLVAFLAYWHVYVGILGRFIGIGAALLIGFLVDRWRMSAIVGGSVSAVALLAACLPRPDYTPELNLVWVTPEMSLVWASATLVEVAFYIGLPSGLLAALGTGLHRLVQRANAPLGT